MVRYKEYVKKMIAENKELFDEFRRLHDTYALNPDAMQEKYNAEGSKVLDVVREYENKLCSNTERGMYVRYSAGLAEKFQSEVRREFPMIDHIGLKVSKFNLKKISLS